MSKAHLPGPSRHDLLAAMGCAGSVGLAQLPLFLIGVCCQIQAAHRAISELRWLETGTSAGELVWDELEDALDKLGNAHLRVWTAAWSAEVNSVPLAR